MTLEAAFRVRRRAFTAELDVAVPAGEPLAIVGPNGTGKTTALHAIAGLMRIDAGRIECDGEAWDDPAARVFRAAEDRRTGLVFQDHRLFPHLNATENIAFGIAAPRRAARDLARQWLDAVGLSDHRKAKPAALSRGQASLVALARTLAAGPRALLLDEPFAALDASAKAATRSILREHLAAYPIPAVIVTHDPLDAFAIAARIAVVEGGRIVQQGSPGDIRLRPASRFVAELAGLNWFEGVAVADGVVFEGTTVAAVHSLPANTPAMAVVHPRAVTLHAAPPGGSARNVFALTAADVIPSGDVLRVTLAGVLPLVAEITPAGAASISLQPGATVYAAVKATEVAVYPA